MAVGAIGFSDWLCASCMTILIGGVLENQRGVWEGQNTVCALFFYALRSVIFCLHAPRASAERTRYCGAGSTSKCVFNATFLPNRSDKRQQSGRIKAVGCWFESGWCVGAKLLRLE